MVVQDENGLTDFNALRSAIYTAPHRLRALCLRSPAPRRPGSARAAPHGTAGAPQEADQAGSRAPRSSSAITSRATAPGSLRPRPSSGSRASSPSGQPAGIAAVHRAHGSRPRTWWRASSSCSAPTETADGVPWALLASDRDGRLEFAGPAILNPPQALRAAWRERMAALAVAKPPVRGLRQGTAQWLRPELRVRVKHLKAKGVLRHATVKQLITD